MRITKTQLTGLILTLIIVAAFTIAIGLGLLNRWHVINLSSSAADYLVGTLIGGFTLSFVAGVFCLIGLLQKDGRKVFPKLGIGFNALVIAFFFYIRFFYPPNQATISNAEMIESGQFQHQRTSQDVDTIVCVQRCDTIKAVLGTKFGIKFQVHGTPEYQDVALRRVYFFPAPGMWDTTRAQFKGQLAGDFRLNFGETRYMIYSFDRPSELLPGVWRFQIWSDQNLLLEKAFLVIG